MDDVILKGAISATTKKITTLQKECDDLMQKYGNEINTFIATSNEICRSMNTLKKLNKQLKKNQVMDNF